MGTPPDAETPGGAYSQRIIGRAKARPTFNEVKEMNSGVCVSLIVMPILSRAKKRVGKELSSAAMNADARQTDFCVYLSAILLAGLILNAVLGWWWADPVAALTMVPIAAKEGFDGVKGQACCDSCHPR
jgi:divalent metal cation (Fe/Co/Zn/Cd) transporter